MYIRDMHQVANGFRRGAGPDLRIGVLPMANFTMLAFAALLDTLRLAADEGDRSRQIRCAWTVMSEDRQPVRASNGLLVQPSEGLMEPAGFDYLAVVGGTLHGGARETPVLLQYLRQAARAGIPLVGLCTGSFTLARAGLMADRRACVSWFHHDDYVAEFPRCSLVSDRLFLDDGDRITCAGGVSVVHLASHLVDRHCGIGASEKGLRIMNEGSALSGESPQPSPALMLQPNADPRVRRALLLMERRIGDPPRLTELARLAGSTPRHLSRLFVAELGLTPAKASELLRINRARSLVEQSRRPLADIAAECGFSDSAAIAGCSAIRRGVLQGFRHAPWQRDS
jgi:transcriptional regulator GlxA family with amidase domain